jgi:formylglycine-generating enzyme required for sulfatase activity
VTAPVGQYPPNAWGLYDMHGNVSEWCLDIYAPYEAKDAIDPIRLPRTRNEKHGPFVMRGGAYRSYPGACRSAFRQSGAGRGRGESHVGFRLISPLPGSLETPGKK